MTNEQTNEQTPQNGNTIIINNQLPPARRKNGFGTAGFVLALLGLIFCWFPVSYVLWPLGVIFSFIGVFKQPKGLAITGLCISFIGIVIIIILLVAVAGAGALFSSY
jgi:hypothetical protein